MEDIQKIHFFHHGKPNCPPGEKEACHYCQLAQFPTHPTHLVSIVNETGDGATLPADFRFINESVMRRGVEAADAEFMAGCQCTDDRWCQYGSCECLDEVEQADHMGREGGKLHAYHTHGDKRGYLRSRYLESGQPIYECHAGCACSADCPNRVVSKGRTIPLQIFRTKDRGWGVRTLIDISKGQFIDRYVGEIIPADEANRRRRESHRAQRKDVYLFALDKFFNEESPDPRLRGPPLEVDGEFMSGPTRFINHSCSPNLRIFARVGDHANKHLHDLALFAQEDISHGSELTFDYVDGVAEENIDANEPGLRELMNKCLCGSSKCRGFLW